MSLLTWLVRSATKSDDSVMAERERETSIKAAEKDLRTTTDTSASLIGATVVNTDWYNCSHHISRHHLNTTERMNPSKMTQIKRNEKNGQGVTVTLT